MTPQPLIPDFDCVWVADTCICGVKKRKKKAVDKELREKERFRDRGFHAAELRVFVTELEAWKDVYSRAVANEAKARKELAAAERALAKVRARIEGLEGDQG